MAERAKRYWASEAEHGPGGQYRVVVMRLAGGKGPERDHYSATLYRRADEGEVAVEADFWRGTNPPHDGDKVRFREKAKRAAATTSEEPGETSDGQPSE